MADVRMDKKSAAIEKRANRRLDILTAELEREKALYNKRQNNQRRILELRRSELRKVEPVPVPEKYRLTASELESEQLSAIKEARKKRAASTSPRRNMSQSISPLPALKLERLKTPVISSECEEIYQDLNLFLRRWKDPPKTLVGGSNRAYVQSTLRSLARELSPDKYRYTPCSGPSTARTSRRPPNTVDRPPTSGPGSKIYEKRQWIINQIEEYEAKQEMIRQQKQAEEEMFLREKKAAEKKKSIWHVMDIPFEGEDIPDMNQILLETVPSTETRKLSDETIGTTSDDIENYRKTSKVTIAVDDLESRNNGKHTDSDNIPKLPSLNRQFKYLSLHEINQLTQEQVEDQESLAEKRKLELKRAWQSMAWAEARKARYVRSRTAREIDKEVDVFPRRVVYC